MKPFWMMLFEGRSGRVRSVGQDRAGQPTLALPSTSSDVGPSMSIAKNEANGLIFVY